MEGRREEGDSLPPAPSRRRATLPPDDRSQFPKPGRVGQKPPAPKVREKTRAAREVESRRGSLRRPGPSPARPVPACARRHRPLAEPSSRLGAALRPQKWSTSSASAMHPAGWPGAAAQSGGWKSGDGPPGGPTPSQPRPQPQSAICRPKPRPGSRGSYTPKTSPRCASGKSRFRFLSICGLGKAFQGLHPLHLPPLLTRAPQISGSTPAGAAKLLLFSRRGRL